MKAVHNPLYEAEIVDGLVIAHVKLQNESSSQPIDNTTTPPITCDCSRKITK